MKKNIPVYGITEFSEKEEEVYFYANELRAHLESHRFVNLPHKHSTYIAVLFTKGTGEHQIDFDTYPVKQGSVFLLSPGQVHCWQLSEDVEGYVFFHTKEFYDRIFLSRKIVDFPFFYLQQNYPMIDLAEKETVKMELLFAEINTEYRQTNSRILSKLETLVDLVYIELTRLYKGDALKTKVVSAGNEKVRMLQKLIDEHFKTKKFPAEYADMMHMTTRHLSRICQELLNKSTGELITERIVIEAKRLLIQKNITVSMVADELGFDDYSYFIRMFKKKVGLSPKEFQLTTANPFSEK